MCLCVASSLFGNIYVSGITGAEGIGFRLRLTLWAFRLRSMTIMCNYALTSRSMTSGMRSLSGAEGPAQSMSLDVLVALFRCRVAPLAGSLGEIALPFAVLSRRDRATIRSARSGLFYFYKFCCYWLAEEAACKSFGVGVYIG